MHQPLTDYSVGGFLFADMSALLFTQKALLTRQGFFVGCKYSPVVNASVTFTYFHRSKLCLCDTVVIHKSII